jgi:YidC/Oxa1 family membrane protein insertase
MELDTEKRALLAFVLTMVVLLVWAKFFAPRTPPKKAEPKKVAEKVEKKKKPEPKVVAGGPAKIPAPTKPKVSARDVVVESPLYTAVFTELGGRLKSFKLKSYRSTVKEGSPPKELVEDDGSAVYPLGTGFKSRGSAPFDNIVFRADAKNPKLSVKEKATSLAFVWEVPDNIRMEKVFTFRPGTYLIGLKHKVTNLSKAAWQDSPIISYQKAINEKSGSRYIFQGPAVYLKKGGLEEVKLKKIKEEEKVLEGALWAGYESQYFFSAILPPKGKEFSVGLSYAGEEKGLLTISIIGAEAAIGPGKSLVSDYDLYFGPKDLKVLKKLGRRLKDVVDFGWFDIIAKPLLYLMNIMDKWIGNYGLAIIIVTILIKVVFWPLTHKSYESMRVMKKLQPKLKELKEKHKDDKAKLNEEMMGLYRAYNVNPMSGCLPMLLQVPIFFAFYRMLYSAIELRHAPFMLWVNDLSAPDRLPIGFDIPYLGGLPVLTLLMGASMFIQQKMTPMSGDPAQQKIFMFMPLIFTVLFVNFPAGLTLYWLVNNVLSIVQQYFINKRD